MFRQSIQKLGNQKIHTVTITNPFAALFGEPFARQSLPSMFMRNSFYLLSSAHKVVSINENNIGYRRDLPA